MSYSKFTKPTYYVASLPFKRWPWLILALSATALLGYALYSQYGPAQLWPCVQCIYQRTAMVGIAVAAWLGVFLAPHFATARWIALITWLGSALAGAYSAYYHSWIQAAANPLFAPCQPHPDFPSWAPLHQWLPQIFDAGGMCGVIDWQWFGLSMPQWLFFIFSTYALIALIVIVASLIKPHKN